MRATILYPLVLFCLSLPAAADVTVASPDGRVRFVLSPGAQGHLEYTVAFNSRNIIDPSPLGIVVDGVDLAGGAQIGKADTYKVEHVTLTASDSLSIDLRSGGGFVAMLKK